MLKIVCVCVCYNQMKVNESEESILEHESFHESLLNMEKWLMIMRQKLESFRGANGEWSVVNRQHEAAVTHTHTHSIVGNRYIS